MSGPECRNFRELLGVYVVGAIEPNERSQLEYHLNQCYDCREELAGLAVLPALLHRIPVAEAEQFVMSSDADCAHEDPAPRVLAGLLSDVGARRRARRWRGVLAAAAAVLVAVGGGAAAAASLGAGQSQKPHAAARFEVAEARQGNIDVTVRYDESRWGTEMWVRVRGVPEWTNCKFWVRTADGHMALAGGWLVGPDSGGLWYPTQAGVSAANVAGFTLTSAGKVLASVPAS
ncbi:MAG TPA: zf-HC2 domain-containing protein [Streptosporangiaceae bacterium]|nr:zf-HC2 domain-containing protein [Streptosporangiaceae bacterium]